MNAKTNITEIKVDRGGYTLLCNRLSALQAIQLWIDPLYIPIMKDSDSDLLARIRSLVHSSPHLNISFQHVIGHLAEKTHRDLAELP